MQLADQCLADERVTLLYVWYLFTGEGFMEPIRLHVSEFKESVWRRRGEAGGSPCSSHLGGGRKSLAVKT